MECGWGDRGGGAKLMGCSAYCGLPAGMESFRVADRVLNEMQEKGDFVRG